MYVCDACWTRLLFLFRMYDACWQLMLFFIHICMTFVGFFVCYFLFVCMMLVDFVSYFLFVCMTLVGFFVCYFLFVCMMLVDFKCYFLFVCMTLVGLVCLARFGRGRARGQQPAELLSLAVAPGGRQGHAPRPRHPAHRRRHLRLQQLQL